MQKKLLHFLFSMFGIAMLLSMLSSCSTSSIPERIMLLNTGWKMSFASDIAEMNLFDSGENVLNVHMQFDKSGAFSITNRSDEPHTVWKGTYTETLDADHVLLVGLTFRDGTQGQAVCGRKTYENGETVPTLTVTIESYMLYMEAIPQT